ncbi:killer cell lectin-like receptor subfamily G member 1 isoform X2 [Pseudonaja textilis]|uniref:killer cell lectin-like receptor subfamily G member 1 isoform X2 n=1 Tax=Pseudonaja textilis TaxID=8673 RepID=UPI000EAA1B13|nr:killer cell lectin-like receptor subfamily G member 1 isoform X2 [Pseudonaja textilis]
MDAGLDYENIQSSEYSSPRRISTKLNVVQQAGPGCSSSTAQNRRSQNPEETTGVSNTHQCNHLENKTNSQLQTFRSSLRQYLCDATDTFTENRSCSVCPRTWLPYKDKCYWISISIQSWYQSYKDCVAKGSQLLVISNTGEQEYVQNIAKNQSTWIGLMFKLPEEKWMWINGSPLNQTLSQPLMAGCGVIGKKGIRSDMCITELHWICQKPSVFI